MARNTLQRKIILDALNCHAQHPTAEDLYNYIAKSHPSISKATVYRNLTTAIENGEILSAGTFNGAMHFDHRSDEHFHFLCEKCNHLFDVPKFEIDATSRLDNFKITQTLVTFKGVCKTCQKNLSNA